jgi:hypothetical protein
MGDGVAGRRSLQLSTLSHPAPANFQDGSYIIHGLLHLCGEVTGRQLVAVSKAGVSDTMRVCLPSPRWRWAGHEPIFLSVATVSDPSPCCAGCSQEPLGNNRYGSLLQRLHRPPGYAGMSQKRSGRRCKPSTRSEGHMRSAAMAPSEANGVTSLFMAGSHTCRPAGFSRRPLKLGICLTAAFTLISRVHSRVGQAALWAHGQRRSAQGPRGQPSESRRPTTC